MAPNGHQGDVRQSSGMPAFPASGYPQARINEQSHALRGDMPGHTYGEGMIPNRMGGSRESELYSDDTSSKTRYECTYCGKGFSRPSALKVSNLL